VLGIKIGETRGIKKGLEKGKEVGKKQGERNKAIKMVKGMLLKGIKINDIADISGLSKEQITKLSKAKKKKY